LILAIVNFVLGVIEDIINIIRPVINAVITLLNSFINFFCDIIDTIRNIEIGYDGEVVNFLFTPFDWLPVPGFCEGESPINPLEPVDIPTIENPLKNFGLPLILNTEDGCDRCKCKNKSDDDVEDNPLGEGADIETSGNLTALLESLSDCSKAVNFKSNPNQPNSNPLLDGEYCYNTDAQGNVTIDVVTTIETNDGIIQAPLCTTALSDVANIIPGFLSGLLGLDTPFKIFQYGRGCYNLLGQPFISLPRDFASLAEWSNRVKVNIAICNEVFDHTFSNAWINGVLFMPSLKNKVTFKIQN
jgi:hypothetical protein